MSKTEKATREYLESLSKDQVINLCLQFMFDVEVTEQQLEEKQKTIDEINKEFVQAVHDWKTLCAEKDKEISKLQASCQVKMQLKDKTKMMSNEEHCYQQKVVSWLDICNQINNQIKELKGE